MLSYGLMPAPHDPQWLAGSTTDSSRGHRKMTTFRKLPMMRPNSAATPAHTAGGRVS
jgi:hypothetical protein